MSTMVLTGGDSFALSLPRQADSKALVRGAALVVALAVHALLFVGSGPQPQPIAPPAVETLELSVVAQGDATTDTAAETQSAAEMAPPPEPEVLEPPKEPEPPPVIEEAPVREDPTALAIPVRKPEPPRPPEVRKPPEPRPVPKPKVLPKPKAPPKADKPSAASVAQHRGHSGAERGVQANASQSLADYGAKLKAEINRHKAYPAAARDRHASGVVLVTFLVGPSGRVLSASVARSAGDAALDQAAVQAVRSASLPPPPGGHFGGRIAIDFTLKR
ncbi:energy transducer TonB [Methylobacterium mesophilicum]|uniref:energy transducer TonB n=1 Tax=Methylobacterium mesophilicum TaxID=39956 RepID=UPI002F3231B1